MILYTIINRQLEQMRLENNSKQYLFAALALLTLSGSLFASTYFGIVHEVVSYYEVKINDIIFMICLPSIFYLLGCPIVLSLQPQRFLNYCMILGAILIAIGSYGRSSCFGSYAAATVWTVVACIGNSLIMSAALKIFKIIEQVNQKLLMFISYVVPCLAQNFNIFYGFMFIARNKGQDSTFEIMMAIRSLNTIVAIVTIILAAVSIMILVIFNNQIDAELCHLQQECNSREIKQKDIQNTSYKRSLPLLFGWSIIIGLNWAYSQTFSVLLHQQTRFLSDKKIAGYGLYASLFSLFIMLYGIYSNKQKKSNYSYIFNSHILTFFGSLVIQSFSAFPQHIFKNQYLIIVGMVAMRGGVSLSLGFCVNQLTYLSGIKNMRILFYTLSIIFGLLANLIICIATHQKCLTLFSAIIWICIFINNQKYLSAKFNNFQILNGNVDENQQLRQSQMSDVQSNTFKS